jgi:trimethylamine--corrinoid protein Co-methyltransferase
MSMATAGSTAPATIAGTIAVADAEMVSAMVLMQMAHPGSPVYHSMMPGIMHPRTGDFLGGDWEAGLFYPVGAELAHMWGVPTLAGIGGEAPTLDWESAVGMAAGILMCAMCGAETASGLGLRETCTLLYPEALILDNESYETAELYARGLEFDPEDFALDVVKAVGPRGHYLTQKHTRKQMREWVLSELINQPDAGGGYRDPIEVARERTAWILENHHPQPLEQAQQAELARILASAEGDLG